MSIFSQVYQENKSTAVDSSLTLDGLNAVNASTEFLFHWPNKYFTLVGKWFFFVIPVYKLYTLLSVLFCVATLRKVLYK